jgi:predicted Zn-dependent protease
LGSALIGDYSSVLATIPATLGHLHYSREFEAEADVHAHALLCAKGINPSHTSRFFDKVAASDAGKRATLIPEYLQSHPQTARRAEFFHTPC